mmetsp:Transcript_68687/g.163865  ORF Transcript_68687/g.163865 Transcript_68687/m.163865 type:complete len:210 (-) Transcript_68687:130-759(-)
MRWCFCTTTQSCIGILNLPTFCSTSRTSPRSATSARSNTSTPTTLGSRKRQQPPAWGLSRTWLQNCKDRRGGQSTGLSQTSSASGPCAWTFSARKPRRCPTGRESTSKTPRCTGIWRRSGIWRWTACRMTFRSGPRISGRSSRPFRISNLSTRRSFKTPSRRTHFQTTSLVMDRRTKSSSCTVCWIPGTSECCGARDSRSFLQSTPTAR